jgi:hypothetical protein
MNDGHPADGGTGTVDDPYILANGSPPGHVAAMSNRMLMLIALLGAILVALLFTKAIG